MKIKFLLAALAISVLVNIPAQAQDECRHEISASYGAVANSTWIKPPSHLKVPPRMRMVRSLTSRYRPSALRLAANMC